MYTTHGHHIPGTTTENPPEKIQRCGGPGLCGPCSNQTLRHITHALKAEQSTPEHKQIPMHEPFKPSPIIRYFESKHLPLNLAAVVLPFESLAINIDENVPNGPEKSVALRKLLEAKDAAVRASLDLV